MSLKNRKSFTRHALLSLPFILGFVIFKNPVFWLLEIVRMAVYIEIVQCAMYVIDRLKFVGQGFVFFEIWGYLKKKGIDTCVDIFAPIATYTFVIALIMFITWMVS